MKAIMSKNLKKILNSPNAKEQLQDALVEYNRFKVPRKGEVRYDDQIFTLKFDQLAKDCK